jgi:major intracellular serine protease
MAKKRHKKNDCGLFPYVKEEIYGDFATGQHIPWSLEKFQIDKTWEYSDGKGVTVAVIDSGCDINHEDLKQNFVDGMNFVEAGKDPIDDNSHGTHVAGTICAKNNAFGVVGVAPSTRIMPVKVFGADGRGSNILVAEAIVWAVDHGADLLCMSLGSPYKSSEIEKALSYAKRKGIVAFCAAGNGGEQSEIYYPARYEETVSIGAIDDKMQRAYFTCKGIELDFLAPGQNILSTIPNNRYALMSGTSMANPFAVGCASLLLSYVKKNNLNIKLNTSDDYINILKQYTFDLQNPNHASHKEYSGNGVIDPRKFIGWPNMR